MNSPLANIPLFYLGPVPIVGSVLVTWSIMVILAFGSFLMTRRLNIVPSRAQAVLELIVETVDHHIRDTMRTDPEPYRAFIGGLFLFILLANWSAIVPGIEPPTAHLETDAALASLVFMAVIWFGISV